MICITLPGPSLSDLKRQLEEAVPIADLIEYRLDLFDKPHCIREIASPIPIILTLRSVKQGGNFSGTGGEQLALLESLLDMKPDYVDLEEHLPTVNWPVQTIRSYHDFSGRTLNLEKILQKMQAKRADWYKIAIMSHSILDTFALLHFARQHPGLIAIAMGEKGDVSRILAPIVKCPFTYACLDKSTMTAQGQLSARELREIYRYQALCPDTVLYGLIGDPIYQSCGHLFHNSYMHKRQAVYVKLHVAKEELPAFLPMAIALGFRGFSVTIPHKEAIIPFLEKSDPIGAINTVTVKEGKLMGTNTDGIGALDALEQTLPVAGKRILLLGAGGAVRAIAFEAKRRGADLIILNRTVSRAKKLAEEVGGVWGSMEDSGRFSYHIAINGTPLSPPVMLKKCAVAMDLSLQPRETAFLQAARSLGCRTIDGMEMFWRQAMLQKFLWNRDG